MKPSDRRTCTDCKRRLRASDFYRNGPKSLHGQCKACMRAAQVKRDAARRKSAKGAAE